MRFPWLVHLEPQTLLWLAYGILYEQVDEYLCFMVVMPRADVMKYTSASCLDKGGLGVTTGSTLNLQL